VKLLRLKITDPAGFRSLQAGFEHHFRTPWELQEEQGFAPFVCAGKNGSGKSNLLEVLAAIFFQLEVLRVRRSFLPKNFLYDEESNPEGFRDGDGSPNGFELEYLIRVPEEFRISGSTLFAQVKVLKEIGKSPDIHWLNQTEFTADTIGAISERERGFLLPQYVLGYSSGGNEILSLPFFKLRFVQFDEYWHALKNQLPYPGRPETRLAYLEGSFSQAILLCNLLFQDANTLKPFRDDVKIDALREFRIIIRRSIPISRVQADDFKRSNDGTPHPAVIEDPDTNSFSLNLMKLLEADERSADNFNPIVTRLKRCATCFFVDEETDTLYLDYYVNDTTRLAFQDNFDGSPIDLFQALQVLLTLNLYSVSDALKADLYGSDSLYVGETVPVLASDERIMRIKHFLLKKTDAEAPILLKSLSDGEHQLLHSLGLCLLFKDSDGLFLLDEPETHFNPDWRSNFLTRLNQCFNNSKGTHEMLITTHAPFLISDSKPEKVLVFNKDIELGVVSIGKPDFNTLGASINKITMNTFGKKETIGGRAQSLLEGLRSRFESGEDGQQIVSEINQQLGDSVEKVLLIKAVLDRGEREI
jgi:restriction system-associated AAA family ATPase